MIENKQLIATRLCDCLALTKQCEGIERIEICRDLGSGDELANIQFKNGNSYFVDVTADSGYALIKDILYAVR